MASGSQTRTIFSKYPVVKLYSLTTGLIFFANRLEIRNGRRYLWQKLTRRLNHMDELQKTGGDSTEQRIFDAAREVFVQKGLDAAKMQEIADRAGINKALLHYYYRSKDKLYEMVVRSVMNRAIPVIRDMMESDAPLEEKIRQFISFYIDLIARNTFIPIFIINEINKRPDHFFEDILPKDTPKPHVFFKQVEAAILEGRLRPLKPQHVLVNILSMCIFPFVARPMIQVIMGMSKEDLQTFISERKEEVTQFVFAAILKH
jgi:AcrR family transcriptional regulator